MEIPGKCAKFWVLDGGSLSVGHQSYFRNENEN